MKVLLVDDLQDMLELGKIMLEYLKYEVLLADNEEDALKLADS